MQPDPLFRITRQRRIILQEIRKVNTHPTADEIYSMVRTVIPHISLGTVYRNLEILAEKGYVDKLEYGGQRRFDGNREKHYHIQCLGCGSVKDIPLNTVESFEVSPEKMRQYRVCGYRLLFQGVCEDCNAKGSLVHWASR
ncbi:MAG: transcriptional repressor [Candidatus Latescibacter sp.]|nr:transcriptional repressor [Candidatus Latescibacter sp.]